MHSVTHLRTSRGFTLIELMIAVAIAGVLLSIALPSFLESVRKGRRSEAFTAISAVQQLQERWRSKSSEYAGSLADLGATGLESTPKGYYTIALNVSNDAATRRTTYTVIATAAGSQASDTGCTKIAARVFTGDLEYGASSGNGDIVWTDPNRCWAR